MPAVPSPGLAGPSLKGRALKLLGAREHSRAELERKLAAHETTPGELARVLESTSLSPGRDAVATNLKRCYSALVAQGFFSSDELDLVDAWCEGLEQAHRDR